MARGTLPRGARDLMEPRRKTTTTIEVLGGPGDPVRAILRKRLAGFMRMSPEAYCLAYWEAMADNPEARLLVYKRTAGVASKIAEVDQGEHDPTDVETWLLATWGDGAYQFQPQVAGRLYGPPSKVFRFGEVTDEGPARVPQEAIDAEIQQATKRLGHLAAIKGLQEIVQPKPGEGGDEMKSADVAALVTAQMTPLMEMVKQSEARAQRAEERADKFLEKLIDARSGTQQVQAPLFAEILKGALSKPEILGVLLNGTPPPESTWLDTIRDVAREFGPAIQSVLAQAMARGGVTIAPMALAPAGGGPATTQPGEPHPTVATDQGDGTMPMPLNEEQTMAKDLMVEAIKAGNYQDALDALEAFPGLMPTEGGAVPLGEFIISKINPRANPRAYLPQLAMLVPVAEFKALHANMLAFVQHMQRRILADEAAVRNGAGTAPPTTREVAGDLRPTRGEAHDDE